jgi:hypothetical protein
MDADDKQNSPEAFPKADHTTERTPNVVPFRMASIVAGPGLKMAAQATAANAMITWKSM